LVEQGKREREGGVVHHGEERARRRTKGEAKMGWRTEGYKKGGIIGDIMIYGW